MKPIRQAELDHYKDQIDSKFRSKASAIDSQIQSQAQDLSDKKKSTFSKKNHGGDQFSIHERRRLPTKPEGPRDDGPEALVRPVSMTKCNFVFEAVNEVLTTIPFQ